VNTTFCSVSARRQVPPNPLLLDEMFSTAIADLLVRAALTSKPWQQGRCCDGATMPE
jgi:hypothetical protein